MELLWKIESIYIGHDIDRNYEYVTICDPHDLSTKGYTAELSRYPIQYRNVTDPYKLDLQLYMKLMSVIKVDSYVSDITLNLTNQRNNITEKKLFYISNNGLFYSHTPKFIDDLTYEGYLTPLGLISVRLRCYYKNTDFKKMVESQLLNVYFNQYSDDTYVIKRDYLLDSLEYCDLLSVVDSIPNYPESVREDLYLANPFIFKWRDKIIK